MLGRVVAIALLGTMPALAAPAAPPVPSPEALPPTSVLEAVPPLPAPPPPPVAPAAPVVAAPARLLEADVGTRLGLRVQNSNPGKPDKLNDLGMDGQVQVLLSGQAMRHILWQANFVGTFGSPAAGTDASGSAAVLDLIGRFEFHDAFNLWVGRMLVPADRSGLSTEWSIAPWLFPGQFAAGAAPVGALQGPHGRSDGVTLWGQLGGGTFKYYLGAFNLANASQSPLYSGRLSLSLLNPEPGYRNASTYYGSKNVLALGAGLQYEHNGWLSKDIDSSTNPPLASDFTELNFDLLFEKNLGVGGVMNLEGALYKFWGSYTPYSITYLFVASYLLPIEVGPGKFQPLFRLQQASNRATDDTDALADAQLGYIIDGLRARLALDYQYSKILGQTGNALLLGLQLLTR
jgi:hypothetical protein